MIIQQIEFDICEYCICYDCQEHDVCEFGQDACAYCALIGPEPIVECEEEGIGD